MTRGHPDRGWDVQDNCLISIKFFVELLIKFELLLQGFHLDPND